MLDTQTNNKRIAKNTILLYFRMFITMGVSLFTSRVILQTLGIEDYGIYNVVAGFVVMFTFINSAMTNATQRYITFALGQEKEKVLSESFCTSLNIHFLIAFIIILFAETFGLWFLNNKMVIPLDRITAANWVFQFSIISTVVMVISVPYNALIIAHEKMSAFAYISIVEVLLKLLIVYLLYLTEFDKLIVYASLLCMTQVLMRIIYGRYCRKHFKESKFYWLFNKNLFYEMINFCAWSLFGNLASVVTTQGLNILLNMFFGPSVNAARGIAVQIQNAVIGFATNFQMALNPQITKNYAIGNLEQMHTLIFASSKYSFFLLWILSLPIILRADTILHIWLIEVPEHTVNFLRIVLFIIIINSMSSPFTISAQANGNIKIYQSFVGGIMLLTVPISYLSLKIIKQPEIVYLIDLLIVITAQIVRTIMMRKMISMSIYKYFKNAIMPITIVFLTSSIIPTVMNFYLPTNILSFLIICFTSILSVITCIYGFGLTTNEKAFVNLKLKQIIYRNNQ